MTRMVWGEHGTRLFETGVDRGVLFPPNSPIGVPWSGLISINEAPTGGEVDAYYQDSIKYYQITRNEDYHATIRAFSAPREFAPCEGVSPIFAGLFATQQPRKPFGFSYRTLIGNDVNGEDHGYKIHLVYNALVTASPRENATQSESPAPMELSWEVETIPETIPGLKPTGHIVINTLRSYPEHVQAVENILYGQDGGADPRMPTIEELVEIFGVRPIELRNRIGNPKTVSGGTTFSATNGVATIQDATAVGEIAKTNFHRNPGAASASGGFQFWGGTPGNSASSETVASSWSRSGWMRRHTWSAVADPNTADVGIYVGDAMEEIGNTRRATAVYRVRVNRTGITLQRPVLHAPSGSPTPGSFNGVVGSHSGYITLTAGETYTVWLTFDGLGPGQPSNIRVQTNVLNKQVGDVVEVSMADIYPGDYQPDREWFWGNSAPDEDWAYEWAGAVNNSRSLQKYARGIKPVPGAVVRRNLSTNPRATAFAPANSADLRWSNDRWSGRGTFSLVTSASDGPITPSGRIPTYARFTLNVSESGTYGFHHGGNPEAPVVGAGLAVTPGETITISSYIRRTGDSGNARLSIRFLDGSGGLGNPTHFDVPAPAGGVWMRVSGTVVVPAGATRLVASSVVTSSVSGTIVDGTGLLVERSGSLGDYFDGETPDGEQRVSQIVYDWEGAANASTSIQRVLVEGGYVRHTANGNGTQLIQANTPTGEGSGTRFNVNVGERIAMRATVRNASPANINVRARFTMHDFAGAPTGAVFYGPVVTIPPYERAEVSVNTLVPEGIGAVAVGVGTATTTPGNFTPASGAILDTTEWAFFSGPKVPADHVPYFTGDTPDTSTEEYSWEGTPNASPSTLIKLLT